MIKVRNISGPSISDKERQKIRAFVQYVFDYFKISNQVEVDIRFVHPNSLTGQDKTDLLKFYAEMEQINSTKFAITVSSKMRSMKDKLLCIGHEMVHVKQYVRGDLIDWWDDAVNYKGQIYTDWQYGPGYFFSPWELEAYGYEPGLYKTFIEKHTKHNSSVV